MLNFDYILTKEPHDIRAVFISDLHLSYHTPALNQAFLQFVTDLIALPKLTHLFILGDFLDSWIGDDDYLDLSDRLKKRHFLTPIIALLQKLSTKTQIFVMTGNRDFLIRQGLCDTFGARLIQEPYFFHQTIRLEHGDRLCTDDISYQRYRKLIQNPMTTYALLHLPLGYRRKLAHRIQKNSKEHKSNKSAHIMNTNETALHHALTACTVLIHGHTHQPSIKYIKDKMVCVLGDWRFDNSKVTAQIGIMLNNNVNDESNPSTHHDELLLCQLVIAL